jgi:hypothetical protein
MRTFIRAVLTVALMIGLVPTTVSAQRWVVDIGVNGGASWYSQLVSSDIAAPDGARFKAGWLTGAQLTLWPAANIGLRANMTYTDRPLTSDGDVPGASSNDVLDHVNLWSGTGDVLFRFRRPAETWMGRETLPFIALGVGRKWFNPPGQQWTRDDQQGGLTGAPFSTDGQNYLFIDETSSVMGLVGLGSDFRMSPRTALRFEVTDRIYKPRVLRVTGAAPVRGAVMSTGDNVASTVHEIGAQLGVHLLLGLRAAAPVAAVPPPPPPPPPAATPPPPPPPAPEPPREDQISVCVIDPAATGGIRMQSAVFRHAQRDTVVMVDGQRRPLSELAVPGLPMARSAPWYMQGQPLVLTVGREQIRFLPYQTATVIDPQRIVYLGNIDRYPVYADRDEVADVVALIQTARAGRTDVELGTLLGQQAQARDAVQRVSFLYVPLDPTGCVFQPLQRQIDVRKGK